MLTGRLRVIETFDLFFPTNVAGPRHAPSLGVFVVGEMTTVAGGLSTDQFRVCSMCCSRSSRDSMSTAHRRHNFVGNSWFFCGGKKNPSAGPRVDLPLSIQQWTSLSFVIAKYNQRFIPLKIEITLVLCTVRNYKIIMLPVVRQPTETGNEGKSPRALKAETKDSTKKREACEGTCAWS